MRINLGCHRYAASTESQKTWSFFLFDCFQGYIASYTHLQSTLLNFQNFRAEIPDLDNIGHARVSIVLRIG